MKSDCREIQRALAERGPEALRTDERAQDHVAECQDCFAFLEAVAEVDAGLARLAPIDAPDELVEELLATLSEPASEQSHEPSAPGARASWWLAAARTLIDSRKAQLTVASAAVVILAALITPQLLMRSKVPMPMSAEEVVGEPSASNPGTTEPEKQSRLQALGYLSDDANGQDKDDLSKTVNSDTVGSDPLDREAQDEVDSSGEAAVLSENFSKRFLESTEKLNDQKEQEERYNLAMGNKNDRNRLADAFADQPAEQPAASPRADQPETKAKSPDSPMVLDKRKRRGLESDSMLDRLEGGALAADGGVYRYGNRELAGNEEAGRAGGKKSESAVLKSATQPDESEQFRRTYRGGAPSIPEIDDLVISIPEAPPEPEPSAGGGLGPVSDTSPSFEDSSHARDVAERFLQERERIEGVVFRAATGYWANTYIPGDPLLRLLYSKLQGSQLERFTAARATPVALHTAVTRLAQPFDPPARAALSVYLHSDRAHLEGRQRMLLQVGLQGTARSSGHRGAMNVGVVLDLGGELAPQSAAAVRALVEAFGEARDIGDRFHLVVAGRATDTADGVVVGPDRFRHGPLRVAVEGLLADTLPETGSSGSSGSSASSVLDLQQAMETAMDRVAGSDDPGATLGSSVVVLVTGRALGDRFERLRRLVHTSAIAGVPVSVVGVGDLVDPGELESLALWGQGNRRLLDAPAGAAALVDRELMAASRTIARAVRLRIRLAAGVELIDVFGSRRLDDEDARRVREAENNIDLRLARNLGIAADRGKDEDGIQIVMPRFQSGDSHVILLDVVVPGPGPVADVTVRYKDLVHLRNGVGRAHLELARAERPAGALETNVLENLLAHRLFEDLDAAGRLLQSGDAVAARRRLAELRSLLSGLTLIVPGLDGDASLGDDIALLDEYLSVLDRTDAVSPSDRTLLADSLRLSGRLKVSSQAITMDASRR